MHLSPTVLRRSARSTAIRYAAVLVTVLAVIVPAGLSQADDSGSDGARRTWQQTPLPVPFGGLSAIDVRKNVAVTVGFKAVKQFHFMPLAAAWDGVKWNRQPVKLDVSSDADVQLDDVDLQSPRRGWLVGNAIGAGGASAVAARWNGSRWRGTPTGQIVGAVGLHGVAVLGKRNVWAVGQEQVGSTLVAAIAHWDGSAWQSVTTPPLEDVGELTALSAVTAESATTLWAVGSGGVCLHFDGTQWSQVAVPTVNGIRPEFQAVESTSPNDSWAVGYLLTAGGQRNPVALHWDGKTWQVATTPRDTAQLNTVTRTRHGAVLAVGYVETGPGSAFYGLRLKVNKPATPLGLPAGEDGLFGADAGPGGEFWVVGTGAVGADKIAPFAAVRRKPAASSPR